MAFVYCDPAEKKTLEPSYVIASLAQQVLRFLNKSGISCPADLKKMLFTFFTPHGPMPDFDDVEMIFAKAIPLFPDAVVVVDGLHELEQYAKATIVSSLRRISKQLRGQQRLFLSCRDSQGSIGRNFHITINHTKQDICTYIDSVLEMPITDDDELNGHIKSTLLERAKGM